MAQLASFDEAESSAPMPDGQAFRQWEYCQFVLLICTRTWDERQNPGFFCAQFYKVFGVTEPLLVALLPEQWFIKGVRRENCPCVSPVTGLSSKKGQDCSAPQSRLFYFTVFIPQGV
jgi:hypothetical protein